MKLLKCNVAVSAQALRCCVTMEREILVISRCFQALSVGAGSYLIHPSLLVHPCRISTWSGVHHSIFYETLLYNLRFVAISLVNIGKSLNFIVLNQCRI